MSPLVTYDDRLGIARVRTKPAQDDGLEIITLI